MPETLNLNYYYGNEADQYSFYRIPKILLTDRRYKGVSLEAKVLYGLLLDRMGLSARNGWLDDNGRVFLYFTQEEAMAMLDCGKDKATKLFRELEGIGLLERKKQGQGHPARIYVKNFILEPQPATPFQTAENQQSRPLDSAAVKTAEKPQSAPLKTSGQECGISAPNNTEINKTEKSDTDLSITPPAPSLVVFNFVIFPLLTITINKSIICLSKRRKSMDYGKMTLDEIKKGYKYDKEKDAFVCNHCGQIFNIGQVFQIEGSFFMAEHAVMKHISQSHSSNLTQLLCSESKYNTLTQNQRDLLAMFYSKMSDKDMAKKLNVTEATIRRQRFTFREKAKQAKFYLAMYELVFEDKPTTAEQIIPIHNNAIYVDDRYLITEDEKQHIIETFFSSIQPLVLKSFSPKEKKKVVILGKIAEQFEYGKKYSEQEVNEILKPIYADYMTIRRYLIMYGFMERTRDGRQYWLTN